MKFTSRLASFVGFSILATLLLAAPARAALVYALTDENDLLTFNSSSPEVLLGNGAISGLAVNEDLVGIDIRPANNMLYGVGSFGNVYSINPANQVATYVSTLSTPLNGSRFGVDFNPVADRLRVVSDTRQSLRINVDTGATIVDGMLTASPSPIVTAVAYTNSFGPSPRVSPGTTLYGIDVRSTGDHLVIVNPPNSGTLSTVGPLGINVGALTGFDILSTNANNVAFAALQRPGGFSEFYSIDLGTGAASLIGEIGGGDLIDGIAVVIPEPASFVLAASALVAGLAVRRRRG